ncbi:MAG: hypothetical protein GX335_09485 [Firmicutes bacterium]|nr:hypothetical protein [Bacillota bacterium]
MDRGWIGYPWFWDQGQKVIFTAQRGETRPGGNHHFGPNSKDFGRAELERLKHLYDIFAEDGYHPERISFATR